MSDTLKYTPEKVKTPESQETSREQIKTQIEEAIREQDKTVEAKELLQNTVESCVDGRFEDGIIGTPGGNAGEFLLLIAAQVGESEVSDEDMDRYLDAFIKKNGKFYMHTAEHSLEHFGITTDTLLSPAEEKKDDLLEKLTRPGEVGCGHLNLALQYPTEYGTNEKLIKQVMKAVYRRMWSESEEESGIEFVILEGGHEEKAVVNVSIIDEEGNEIEVTDESNIPMVAPKVEDTAFFINHPQVMAYMRKKMVENAQAIFAVDDINEEELLEKINILANKQMAQTVGRLAGNFPIFKAVYRQTEKGLEFVEIKDDASSVEEIE